MNLKVLAAVNSAACGVLLAAGLMLMVQTDEALERVGELETSIEKSALEHSNEISALHTRLGEIDARVRTLADSVEKASSGVQTASDIEYQVKKILDEERKGRQKQWQGGGMEGWQKGLGNLNLDEGQRQRAAEMVQKGTKDWMDLHAKVQAGEMTQEEAKEIGKKAYQDGMAKFREMLTPEQRAKLPDQPLGEFAK